MFHFSCGLDKDSILHETNCSPLELHYSFSY